MKNRGMRWGGGKGCDKPCRRCKSWAGVPGFVRVQRAAGAGSENQSVFDAVSAPSANGDALGSRGELALRRCVAA